MGSPEQPPGDAGQRPGEGDFDWESPGLGTRVNEIVDAVEREAAKLRQEAEQDAQQIRLQAQEEAQRYADQARQQTDAMAAQRVQRIQELSDALMARAEEVLERLDYAVPVKAGFENLVKALGETAERLASQDYSDVAQPSWEEVREATPPPATGAPLPGAGEPPPEHSPAFAAPGTATVPPPGGYPQPGEGAPTPGYPPPADQAIGQSPPQPPARRPQAPGRPSTTRTASRSRWPRPAAPAAKSKRTSHTRPHRPEPPCSTRSSAEAARRRPGCPGPSRRAEGASSARARDVSAASAPRDAQVAGHVGQRIRGSCVFRHSLRAFRVRSRIDCALSGAIAPVSAQSTLSTHRLCD